MFKKGLRLPKSTKFTKENQISSSFFLIQIAENGTDFNRFGVIVSKKIDKRATVRNRIKRQIRHCVEENKNDLPIGRDILILVRNDIKNKETKEICKSIAEIFRKIK